SPTISLLSHAKSIQPATALPIFRRLFVRQLRIAVVIRSYPAERAFGIGVVAFAAIGGIVDDAAAFHLLHVIDKILRSSAPYFNFDGELLDEGRRSNPLPPLKVQFSMQWRKPLAVVAPVVKPITVYRSAHLLCARRMHRPLILVIVQAGWIEWQVQPIEQTPDFSIDIFHYLFILHAQDAAGQSGIHMC